MFEVITYALAKRKGSEQAQKQADAAKSYANAAKASANEASATEVKVTALANAAKVSAQEAAGYAGAATYALGPDENGNLSFFMNEEE